MRIRRLTMDARVDRVLRSRIDAALTHEAAFLYECADPEGMWRQIARLTRSGEPGPRQR